MEVPQSIWHGFSTPPSPPYGRIMLEQHLSPAGASRQYLNILTLTVFWLGLDDPLFGPHFFPHGDLSKEDTFDSA